MELSHASPIESKRDRRLAVDVFFRPASGDTLARDVARGLRGKKKSLPPKYFYDEVGSKLFDRICDTPEYYPTRTEQALLEQVADRLIATVDPTDIVELGSGAARKTRALLDAATRGGYRPRYVPFDVSEEMLLSSSKQLLAQYPWLKIHGVVGDYERHLDRIPQGDRRLMLFIGSTIGNFEPDEAVRFLGALAGQMTSSDRLLLGTDLVKEHAVLDAAYNDAQGVTEAFNKNVLSVVNRELGADFRLDHFEHVAFFNAEESRVEMHLRSTGRQTVRIPVLGMQVEFREGETIHTEISRKFTRASLEQILSRAGLQLTEWFTPENEYFALSLCRRV